jgi:tetratricopeptide (TPR) repeat protein
MDRIGGTSVKWVDIWRLFDPAEQHDACLCLLEAFKQNWQGAIARRTIERLAGGTGARIGTVESLIRENPDKAGTLVRTRAAALLDDRSWGLLFESYLPRRKGPLLKTFVEELGLVHDGEGRVEGQITAPPPEHVAAAVDSLLKTYSVREVARYLAVLVKHSSEWYFLVPHRDRLIAVLNESATGSERSAVTQSESTAASSMEFNVLDQVIIEQIVRAAMQIEGSMDARQAEELVETAIRLNEKWFRAYFHLGFMDVLLPGRTLRFDHPGDNQARRGWYLAGVVAGMVRSNDLDGLNNALDERTNDLVAALSEPGGPGASIARTAFRRFVEAGRVSDALAAMRGQIRHLGLEFGAEVLEVAAAFIRQSQYERAKVIVDELGRHSFSDESDDEVIPFRRELSRRRAQCLQAAGDFDGAEREYRDLLKAGEDSNSPDLLADLGLVRGRFRTLAEVRVPEITSARIAMRESLAKGEEFYKRAAERFGNDSPKSAYPLAVLGYLRWSFANDKDQEERREKAADLASRSVSAILASEQSAIYRQIGALGQSHFMLAVTRMSSYEDVQGREAVAAWQTITGDAGRFAVEDLKRLVSASEVHGPDIADPIAESIWEYRPDIALEILGDGPWMTRSTQLRAWLTSLAKLDITPRAERIRLWTQLVPVLIGSGDIAGAEEGLGELERLAETNSDVENVLEFLLARTNYDPAWKETEASMARLYLFRRLGRDGECAQELRRIFYVVRDGQRWEAEQILVMFDEWGLDATTRDELRRGLPRTEVEDRRDIEDRLRDGERVRLVFIGGNEMQAQYDKPVREQLVGEWPGVALHFEHTGWSSNWGRDLARLIELANSADAVVLMPMMRTTLGRRIREALKKPWLSCTSTGKGGMLLSLRQAAQLVVGIRLGGSTPR